VWLRSPDDLSSLLQSLSRELQARAFRGATFQTFSVTRFGLVFQPNTEYADGWHLLYKGCLPMSFVEYLNLLDWTGRQLRADKRGAIPQDLAPILERLQIGGEAGWLQLMGQFSRLFRRAAGRPISMQREREQRGCRLMQGIRSSRAVFF